MKSILCVDDDQDILDTLNIILTTEGFQSESQRLQPAFSNQYKSCVFFLHPFV